MKVNMFEQWTKAVFVSPSINKSVLKTRTLS